MKESLQSQIWELLKKNISHWQFLGYTLANYIGLTVILAGLLFFCDSRHTEDGEDQFISKDYVILSRKVDGVKFKPVTFSDEDIEKLRQQEWVSKIGFFTASRFAVNGVVEMSGRQLSSYLFLESVPDEFFDIKPKDWRFDPEERFVPIIISKDYLALYNFGFAVPQGLPQVSEKIVGAVPITLIITGKGNASELFDAAIVGFSSRLNTIAVPQDFMEWANDRFSDDPPLSPSRLIVQTNRFSSSDMRNYLKGEEMEIAEEEGTTGQVSDFLSLASAVVTVNGIMISLLAIFILILSVFLLLQKNRVTLRNLMLLGYSPKEISHYYEILILCMNCCITFLSLFSTLFIRRFWDSSLRDIGLGGSSFLPIITVAFFYLFVVMAINIKVIRQHLRSIWDQ